eukprot:105068-Amphidinium_carterae.2
MEFPADSVALAHGSKLARGAGIKPPRGTKPSSVLAQVPSIVHIQLPVFALQHSSWHQAPVRDCVQLPEEGDLSPLRIRQSYVDKVPWCSGAANIGSVALG